jgi:hypothetical protein
MTWWPRRLRPLHYPHEASIAIYLLLLTMFCIYFPHHALSIYVYALSPLDALTPCCLSTPTPTTHSSPITASWRGRTILPRPRHRVLPQRGGSERRRISRPCRSAHGGGSSTSCSRAGICLFWRMGARSRLDELVSTSSWRRSRQAGCDMPYISMFCPPLHVGAPL